MKIPEIGKTYHFFDDGKITSSRHYLATVKRILTIEEAKKLTITRKDRDGLTNQIKTTTLSLYDIWKDEVENHDWLYDKYTDFFIECSIPEYDKDPIYFVRQKDKGWFSIDVTNWWQSGELDVDEKLYNRLKQYEEEIKNTIVNNITKI